MSEQNPNKAEIDPDLVREDQYKGNLDASLSEVMDADKDDSTLNTWKANLLERAGAKADCNITQTRIVEFKLLFKNHEPYVFDLTDPECLERYKNEPIIIKEGARFKFQAKIEIENEVVVVGLCMVNAAYRLGVRVNKSDFNIGSFPFGVHDTTFPRKYQVFPSGFMARGTYTARCRFACDDEREWPMFEYKFTLAKNWPN
ncbi:hypothetical protein PCE1_003461 [Barthelona sp. PCE]